MNKPRTIIVFLLVSLAMVLAVGCSGSNSAPSEAESYADLIFDTTRVHEIEVTMSDEDRADQLANPKDKTKYAASVVVDGEQFENVTFKTKGNSSLFFTVDAGKDKFSYSINFGTEDGGTFHGLDKLNLQNNFADATSMKEYMAFWLFRRMGVDAPLASYAWLTVNGEPQGFYTALEDIDDSFLARTAAGEGAIYEPEAQGMALTDEEMERLKEGNSAAHDSGGGADLVYTDDYEESYPDIFENAGTDEDEQTRARVIEALKALSDQEDLETYLDTEEIIRYFAVHDYLVNYDSYTGPMLHNYYLHEKDGQLSMLPWDYDNAFGSFPPDAKVGAAIDSTEAINAGIDSPLGGIPDEARPMWSWILSDEGYLKEYHEALSELVNIIDSKEFAKESNRIGELILPYIEEDPKAFFTPDEFEKARMALLAFSELRAESVRKQLDGQLASRSDLQVEGDRVDASGLVIADMGSLPNL